MLRREASDPVRPPSQGARAVELKPIEVKRESVMEQVFQSLTEYFFSGGIAPGEKLPSERRLAESLGVSRSAVHHVTQSLGLMGALDIRPGDGTYLRHGASGILPKVIQWGLFLGEMQVLDLVETRAELEVTMAGFAAERRSETQLEYLAGLLEKMAEQSVSELELVELDVAFHTEISSMAQNTILCDLLSSVTGLVRAWMSRSIRAAGAHTSTIAEHQAIYVALVQGNVEVSRQAMRVHMQQAQVRLFRTLDQHSGPDGPGGVLGDEIGSV